MIDKKSKILFALFFAAIAISFLLSYFKIIVKNDFVVFGETSCDPVRERCFSRPCEDENDCGDPASKYSYYKLIKKNFKGISCGSNNEKCNVLSCNQEEKNCTEILCDKQNVKDGEECNDPEAYNNHNSDNIKNNTE
jgi:hypothetical protein